MSEEKKLGGIKHDTDKVDFALVPIHSLTEVAKVWTFGKKKYTAWNWKGGFIWSRPYAAALRHIYAWARGEDKDPETGLPHLAHAICCLQMLIEFGHTGTGEDDRQKEVRGSNGTVILTNDPNYQSEQTISVLYDLRGPPNYYPAVKPEQT